MVRFKIGDIVTLKDDHNMYFVDGYESHKGELLVFVDGANQKTVNVDDVERHWDRGPIQPTELIEETYSTFVNFCETMDVHDMFFSELRDVIAVYSGYYFELREVPVLGDLHSNWLYAHREWTYGESIDEENKKHPDKVPYENLPIELRLRDYLIIEALTEVVRTRGG